MNRYEVFEMKRHLVTCRGETWTEIEVVPLSVVLKAPNANLALNAAQARFPRKFHNLAVQPAVGKNND